VRVALDTNVLVYAVTRQDAVKRNRAREVIRQAFAGDALLPLQALAECCHAIQTKRLLPHARTVAALRVLRTHLPVVVADPNDLNEAFALIDRHGLQFWDAMIVATVARAGCALLISEDMQDRAVYGGVEVINPFAGHSLPRRVREALSG
jgi:predicted nucleic acid-binding protein